MNLFKTVFRLRSIPTLIKYHFSVGTPQMELFTDIFDRRRAETEKKKYSSGRAWLIDELRLKSTDDLHKLWYLLLLEKNKLLSDNMLKKKIYGSLGSQGRLIKVKVTMARLLTVISERKKICEEYRSQLEQEYIEKHQKIYNEKLAEFQKEKEKEVKTPEITHHLIRAKYRDLKKGIDNTDYIKTALEIENKKNSLKQELKEKFDYKTKKIVKPDAIIPAEQENSVIRQFQSGIMEQIKTGRFKISQEEVLRSHIKNWKMLNLKQRRVILGFLNARRAKDSKSEFLKELNLLSQKIAYDNMQMRLNK